MRELDSLGSFKFSFHIGRTEGAYRIEGREKAEKINVWPTQEESCLYTTRLVLDLVYKRKLLRSY